MPALELDKDTEARLAHFRLQGIGRLLDELSIQIISESRNRVLSPMGWGDADELLPVTDQRLDGADLVLSVGLGIINHIDSGERVQIRVSELGKAYVIDFNEDPSTGLYRGDETDDAELVPGGTAAAPPREAKPSLTSSAAAHARQPAPEPEPIIPAPEAQRPDEPTEPPDIPPSNETAGFPIKDDKGIGHWLARAVAVLVLLGLGGVAGYFTHDKLIGPPGSAVELRRTLTTCNRRVGDLTLQAYRPLPASVFSLPARSPNGVRQLDNARRQVTPANLATKYFNRAVKAIKQQDFKESTYWYAQSARIGHGEAMFRLAHAYYLGRGVPKQPVVGFQLLWLASVIGDHDAHILVRKFVLGLLEKGHLSTVGQHVSALKTAWSKQRNPARVPVCEGGVSSTPQ